jgi:predicted NBD/HSP70 family sugar kinase
MTEKKKKLATYIASRINLETLDSSRPVFQYIVENRQASLSETAESLGLSRGTCNLHLQRLEHEQLIRRFESVNSGAGRPTVIWGVDEPANMTIALVFDVPFLHASLTDFSMTPVLREAFDLSAVSTPGKLNGLIRDFLVRANGQAAMRKGNIRQVAAFVPGLLDPASGMVKNAVNFPLLNKVDFKTLVHDAIQKSCSSVPLGLAFYFGESEHLPANSNNMVIYWDLGVGVVFGHGDRLCALGSDARDGAATLSELGHIRIRKNGRKCHCGNTGCLEAYVGGWAMIEDLKRKSVRGLNDLIHLVLRGDATAVKTAREVAETMGRHLAWPVQVMQTDRILVSGPLAPIFAMVAGDFRRGLADMFDEKEIARLDPQASPVFEERFLRGAHRLAMRLFSHPDDYELLLRTPSALTRTP